MIYSFTKAQRQSLKVKWKMRCLQETQFLIILKLTFNIKEQVYKILFRNAHYQ